MFVYVSNNLSAFCTQISSPLLQYPPLDSSILHAVGSNILFGYSNILPCAPICFTMLQYPLLNSSVLLCALISYPGTPIPSPVHQYPSLCSNMLHYAPISSPVLQYSSLYTGILSCTPKVSTVLQ